MSPKYDIFISYNSKDRDIVNEIVSHLKNHDIKIWLDSHNIPLGTRWIPALEEGIRNSKIFGIFIGENELGPWQQNEFEIAINNKYRVLPVLLPGADPENIPDFIKLFNWLDLRVRAKWDDGFQQLALALETKLNIYENKMTITDNVQLDFYNREHEQSRIDLPRLETTYHHFISIEAPSGYGKSHLLKYIVQRTNTEPELSKKWISYYIDVSKIEGNQITYILEFISGESQYQNNDAARKFLCNYIQTELPKQEDVKNLSRGILLVFDAVEELSPHAQSWLCLLLHDVILQSYMDYDLNNVAFPVRVLIGGRNTSSFWEEMVNNELQLRPHLQISLSPFDRLAIEDLIWRKGNQQAQPPQPATVQKIANELEFLGGGHPGVLCQIVDELARRRFGLGSVEAHFEENREAYTERFITPVAEEIYKSCDASTCQLLKVISCFRLVNIHLLRKLVDDGLLDPSIDPMDELGKLTQAKILSLPTQERPFYSDHLIRRILSLHLQYCCNQGGALYTKIQHSAKDLYAEWIMEGFGEQRFAIIEWFFHTLQVHDLSKSKIRTQFKELLAKLPPLKTPYPINKMIADEIKKDHELQYLIHKRSLEDDVDQWLK